MAASDALTPTKWGMQVKEAHGNTVHLSIMSSAGAIVGRYEIFIETKSKRSSDEESMSRYQHDEQICVLFNAWCAGNYVYCNHYAYSRRTVVITSNNN